MHSFVEWVNFLNNLQKVFIIVVYLNFQWYEEKAWKNDWEFRRVLIQLCNGDKNVFLGYLFVIYCKS